MFDALKPSDLSGCVCKLVGDFEEPKIVDSLLIGSVGMVVIMTL